MYHGVVTIFVVFYEQNARLVNNFFCYSYGYQCIHGKYSCCCICHLHCALNPGIILSLVLESTLINNSTWYLCDTNIVKLLWGAVLCLLRACWHVLFVYMITLCVYHVTKKLNLCDLRKYHFTKGFGGKCPVQLYTLYWNWSYYTSATQVLGG